MIRQTLRLIVTTLSPLVVTSNVSATVLEEVVVTAQKREQSMQDVGLSVSAISGDDLKDGQVNNALDLKVAVPSIAIGENFGFSQIFIRGIGLDNVFNGADPSVAMHVDGAVISRPAAQLGAFFDLQQVEVLRGPQGTLYGRNATGGAVNLMTKDPTEELSGNLDLTLGDYNLFVANGAISGPIVADKVLGRLAIKSETRDGYGENVFDGSEIDDADRLSIRAKLKFLLSDNVDLTLSATNYQEDDAAYALKFVEETFQNPTDPGLAAPGTGQFATDIRDLNSDVDIQNDREMESYTAVLNWYVNDTLSIKSITNYLDFKTNPVIDLDLSPLPIGLSQAETSEQVTQELQFSLTGENYNGLIGLYYFEEEITGELGIGGSAPDKADPSALAVFFGGEVDIEARAVFANFDINLATDLILNLGGRYSWEERIGNTTLFDTPAPSCPCTFKDSGTFESLDPRVGLQWFANDDIMVYGTYSEGFKSGIFLTGQLTPLLDPETVNTFEIGAKTRLLDNSVQLNVAAFYYDFKDLQVGRTEPLPGGGFQTIFENAASAESQGIEIEGSWAATDDLTVKGFVSYLDATFNEFVTKNPLLGDTPAGDIAEDVGGNKLVQAPEWTAAIGFDYNLGDFDWGTVEIGVDVSYKDELFFTPQNSPRLGQDAETIVDANIKINSTDETWYVNIWSRNLTDEDVYSSKFAISTARSISGAVAAPQTWGVTFGYNL